VEKPREPLLNVPAVVIALLLMLCAVHAVRTLLLSDALDRELLRAFAFVPSRYDAVPPRELIGGFGAQIWTFVTYAFIHADLTHLGFNSIWLLAFGSPVARRFGAARFLAFSAVTAAAGAAVHLAMNIGQSEFVIGASAAISGMMGGSLRFAFQPGGALDMWRRGDGDPDHAPAASLIGALRNRQVLIFLAIWFGLNFVFGLGALSFAGADQVVAWEAHIGGFLAGLVLFSAFDSAVPLPPQPRNGSDPSGSEATQPGADTVPAETETKPTLH
jgi:membrane associated rhomboid family serine protease